MARETKSQRLARQEAEEASSQAKMIEEYPEQLMVILERASFFYEISVKEGAFQLRNSEDSSDRFTFNVRYDTASQRNLEEIKWTLDMLEAEVRERERRAQIKQQALQKLSKEEREILGI